MNTLLPTRNGALRGNLLLILLVAADCLVILDSFTLAYFLRFRLQFALVHADPAPVDEYVKAMVVVAYFWLLLFKVFGLYDLSRRRSPIDTVQLVMKAVTFGTLIIVSLTFFYRQFSFSRLVCLYAWVLAVILFSALRICLEIGRTRHHKAGQDLVNTVVIGSRHLARFLIHKIYHAPELGYRLVGAVDEIDDEDELKTEEFPIPFLGSIADLDRLVKEHQVGGVLIANPSLGHLDLLGVIEVCERRGVSLRMVPPTFDLMINYRDFEEIDGIPLVRVNEQEYRRWGDLVKRTFDVVVSATVVVAMAPVLLLAAIAVRLEDGGPVFFVQRRVGKDQVPFPMIKLRTMVVEAEELLPQLVDLQGLGEPVYKLDRDPRITRVGRFLRRSSLDELPQLINVLRGQMSLVGPRPEEESLVKRYSVWERRRLKTVPGITGLQQVQCRGSKSLKQRVRWDILYVRKRSFFLDLWILLKTGWVVVCGKGAR